MSDAWEVFCASLDPAQLERERCRVVSTLGEERPMCRKQRQVMWAHERRAAEFWRSANSGSWSPLPDVPVSVPKRVRVPKVERRVAVSRKRNAIPKGRQLQIALAALEKQEEAA